MIHVLHIKEFKILVMAIETNTALKIAVSSLNLPRRSSQKRKNRLLIDLLQQFLTNKKIPTLRWVFRDTAISRIIK